MENILLLSIALMNHKFYLFSLRFKSYERLAEDVCRVRTTHCISLKEDYVARDTVLTSKVQSKPAGQGSCLVFAVQCSQWLRTELDEIKSLRLLSPCSIIVPTLNSLSLHFRFWQEVLARLRYQGEIRHYPPVITPARVSLKTIGSCYTHPSRAVSQS